MVSNPANSLQLNVRLQFEYIAAFDHQPQPDLRRAAQAHPLLALILVGPYVVGCLYEPNSRQSRQGAGVSGRPGFEVSQE
jgi:hypothetical protein